MGNSNMNNIVDIIEKDLCNLEVPSGFNIYKWAKENPDTTIAWAIKRIEKIFDLADEVSFGLSGGKDSSLTAQLAILELKRRRARVKKGIDRYGNEKIDELDKKWLNKKLWVNSMDAEWVFTDAINSIINFCKKYGPSLIKLENKEYLETDILNTSIGVKTVQEIYNAVLDGQVVKYKNKILAKDDFEIISKGDNVINLFYKCLRLGWQSGVSFSESRLTSWDLKAKDMWIRPMPTREEVRTDVITNESIKTANPVPLASLSKEMQEMRRADGSVFVRDGIELVANYGLGNKNLDWAGYQGVEWNCWTFENQDEDNEQESFSAWMLEQFPPGTQIYNLIALRAAESFDRYTILRQSDYSTGEYAKNVKK